MPVMLSIPSLSHIVPVLNKSVPCFLSLLVRSVWLSVWKKSPRESTDSTFGDHDGIQQQSQPRKPQFLKVGAGVKDVQAEEQEQERRRNRMVREGRIAS